MKAKKSLIILAIVVMAMASLVFFMAVSDCDGSVCDACEQYPCTCQPAAPGVIQSITAQGFLPIQYVGDTTLSSGRIRVEYDNGTHRFVNFPNADIAVIGFISSAPVASQTVTLVYGDFTTTVTISIVAVAPTSISIAGFRVYYVEGNSLERRGTVTIRYNNGATRPLPFANAAFSYSGWNSTYAVRNLPITVYYRFGQPDQLSTRFFVTINR